MSFSSSLLSDEFLSKYKNKQPNWGFNGLGYIVYKRTYARELENGETEEWWQTVARCINGAQKIGAQYSKEEAERLFDLVFNLKCNFAGRMLWQLGTSTVDRFGGNSLLNCFRYSTKVLTRQGWKQIGDLAGKEVEIVTKNGKWVTASFKAYGKQKLMKTSFEDKGGNVSVIYSTPEHRWLVLDKNQGCVDVLTKNLKVNDRVPVVRGKNSSKEISPQGVQHGLVFGDGSCNGYESFVDLIDNTYDECKNYFSLNRISWTNPENSRHVRFAGMPNYYKQLPDINENKPYLTGFLAGWLAADGSVNKSNGKIRLFNCKKEVLEFARDVAAVLGYRTSSPYLERDHNPFDSECETSELWSISFYLSDNPHHLIIRQDHRAKLDDFERDYNNWAKVISNELTDLEEEVYCAEVPDTHSFVIEGNILTGNCWFLSMNEPKAFLFLFENLMLGGGVGFSIRREDVHELPKIKKGVEVTHKDTKDADFIVPDTREGWIKLLANVLEAFYSTGKSFSYSTILVRGYGEPIKGFGGKASGPAILISGIEKISSIFKAREGKKLRSIDVLDICNVIGSVVVAGNVRRCLPIDSLVHSKKGLIPIQDIKIGDEVLTSSGYFPVKNTFDQGIQETIIIVTQDGEFECTPNHKMAVLTDINQYIWKEACTLKSGDRLISTRVPIKGERQSLPSWSYIKPAHSTTCQDIIIPELDADLAWLIGAIHGDGYVFANKKKNGENSAVNLVFAEHEYHLAEKAKTQLERFGVTNVTLRHRKNENSWLVLCLSKQLAAYFHENIKQPKTIIRIPDFIKKSEYDIKMAYICGVLDSDGFATGRPLQIMTTVYESFAKEVQALLYSCGIESRLRKDGNPPSRAGWQELFKLSLITLYARKKLIDCKFSLKNIPNKSLSRHTNSYPIEWIKTQPWRFASDKVNIDVYSREENVEPLFIPVEVEEIRKGRNVQTFDIEVEEVHEFFCNGYLTHNSAEIALGDPDDILFLRAKNWNSGNIPNWRGMSNNTQYIDDFSHVMEEFWTNGYEVNPDTKCANGEPYGFFNLPLSQKYGRLKDGPMKDSDLYPEDIDNVVGTNPCVRANTLVLTELGQKPISELVGQRLKVWNGYEWSTVEPKITGHNQRMIKVTLSDGNSLVCTEYHKWLVSVDDYKEIAAAQSEDYFKAETLRLKIGEKIWQPGHKWWNPIKVVGLEYVGVDENVYCFEEPNRHLACFNNIITGNCGEISLSNYECCNLAELYLNNISSEEELQECAKLLYKTQKAIASLPFLHEETTKIVHKNMRLGLGVTGLCQSFEKIDWLDKCYVELRKFDKEWSEKRGWPQSIKLTTIKPSGTLSLLGGATPGIHPAYSKHYLRTIRMSSDDKLVQICKDLGYHVEFLIGFDGSEDRKTVVVSFPCKTPDGALLTKDTSLIEQLNLVKKLQSIWSDNAVSITAYYKPEELDDLKNWLKENYKESIKSVSFLLHKEHGFVQAPYQEIEEWVYAKLKAKVKPLSSLTSKIQAGEIIADVECAGGACPIR